MRPLLRVAAGVLAAVALQGAGLVPARADGLPDAAVLEQEIGRAEVELRRAGSAAARGALERRLANLHVLRARVHGEAGDVAAALAAYDEALRLVPGHPVALVEAGWQQLRAGRPERARGLVETALAHDPNDPWALILRGELLYADDRLDDALADFEAAAARRPDDPELPKRIAKVRRELSAERSFRRADSSSFVLRFDGGQDPALRDLFLDLLEREFAALRRDIDVTPLPPITVILYTRQAFHETTGTGTEVLGLYDGKVRLPAGGVTAISAALTRVVRHELVHALLHARTRGKAPRWLHEGVAQLLEPRAPGAAGATVRSETPAGQLPGLEPFSYPRALSFVAWLDREHGRNRLLWFVDQLRDGASEDDAFRRVFGGGKAALVEEWGRWLSASR